VLGVVAVDRVGVVAVDRVDVVEPVIPELSDVVEGAEVGALADDVDPPQAPTSRAIRRIATRLTFAG